MTTLTELHLSELLVHRVAAEVRAQAGRRGINQIGLANILGLSQPQISSRMRGHVPFRLDEIDLLAAAFGIEAAELMPPKPPTQRGPHPMDEALKLPHLDSNQEPAGYGPYLVNRPFAPSWAPLDTRCPIAA
jgi:transcriptional regulator with XRE-family HTH domain